MKYAGMLNMNKQELIAATPSPVRVLNKIPTDIIFIPNKYNTALLSQILLNIIPLMFFQ